MKRVVFLLGMSAVRPTLAQAQVPIGPGPAPAAPATNEAPAPSQVAPGEPNPSPGDEYFLEQAPSPPPTTAAPAPSPIAQPAPFEPPPPSGAIFEPPAPAWVPPVAPRTSLWLGVRLGWFVPFGRVWARAKPVTTAAGIGYALEGVPWQDYASSGPMLEIDAGVRVSRAYTVFALWERAQLGSGDIGNGIDGAQDGAETDFWALGLRASSNANALGFLTEVAVGYRRARTFFTNGVEYQFTDAPFEARLGLGAELRLNRRASLSSLVTVGVGGFGSAERVTPNGTALSLTGSQGASDGHAWVTLSVGGHFDLISSTK